MIKDASYVPFVYYYVDEWFLNRNLKIDSREIKQDICVHIWKKRKLLNKNSPIKPWIKTIVSNLLKNYIRDLSARKRKESRFYIDPDKIYTKKENSIEGDFVKLLSAKEFYLYLRLKEGDSLEEISKKIKTKKVTLYKRREKMRAKFRKVLNNNL